MICRSLLYGEGLFETFRWLSEPPVFLKDHFERMKRGARLLGVPVPNWKEFRRITEKKVEESKLTDARVKVCLFSIGPPRFDSNPVDSVLVCFVSEYEKPKEPVRLHLISFPKNSASPIVKIKSLNYLENVLGRREARSKGFDEGLFLNERGEVAECCTSNIFWMKGRILYTPHESCGLLPGITRKLIISLAPSLGLEIEIGRYKIEEVLEADCVFLSNSLIGICEVAEIEGVKLHRKNKYLKELKQELFRLLRWQR